MTASILARDAQAGELGVAVFTAYPSVGMRVPFAEPGVGVVATQVLAERSLVRVLCGGCDKGQAQLTSSMS